MFHLACTRFTTSTYHENVGYRNKHNEAVIYGISIPIRDIYPLDCLLFVVEMNNTTNCVEGIGLIRNRQLHDKRYIIYENNEYNRYIYRGTYWLSRTQIGEYSPMILDVFETILFKGKTHLKHRYGINVITDKLFIRWNFCYDTIKQTVRLLFRHYFKPQPELLCHNEIKVFEKEEDNKEEEEEEKKVFEKKEDNKEEEEDEEKEEEEEEDKIEIVYITTQKRKHKTKLKAEAKGNENKKSKKAMKTKTI